MSYSTYENEADFQKLSQTIATSIQKILQNGILLLNLNLSRDIDKFPFDSSIVHAKNGRPIRHGPRFT